MPDTYDDISNHRCTATQQKAEAGGGRETRHSKNRRRYRIHSGPGHSEGWFRLLILGAVFGFVFLAVGRTDDAPAEGPGAPPVVGQGIFPPSAPFAFWDDELLIPEVFQSHLPTTLEKYALRLWVHPHIGDLQNKDYLRLTTGVRYGLTENWEISVASDLYLSHGYGEKRWFERYGAANLQLGMKVNLGQPLFPGWYVGVGFDSVFPTDRPPPELTDGLRHFMPYVTFSHRLESHKDLRIFFGLRADAITYTPWPGEFSENAFRESSTGVTGGCVIDRKNWHYTFEAEYDTTRWLGHSGMDVFTLRPGVIWEIPLRRNPRARGHWVVGVAVKTTFGPGGTSYGASFKLRYSRDLKSTRHHIPIAPNP